MDSLSSSVLLYVNVDDVNDNAPVFDPSSYSNDVWENATLGTSVLMVSATDLDHGAFPEGADSVSGDFCGPVLCVKTKGIQTSVCACVFVCVCVCVSRVCVVGVCL